MGNKQPFSKIISLLSLILLSSFCFAQVNEQWVRRYDGVQSFDFARAVVVDKFGNVYVTGQSQGFISGASQYVTVKYDAAGNELWLRKFESVEHPYNAATAIAVDLDGNIYVTGESRGSENKEDYLTIKYDTDGNELWVKRYNGIISGPDIAQSVAVDVLGNVYVTGNSVGTDGTLDIVTIKYEVNGSEQWIMRYLGDLYSQEEVNDLAVDAQGNVYVTGYTSGIESNSDYATVKYNTHGVEQWARRYNHPFNSADFAQSLALDAQGNVYVTGESWVRAKEGGDNEGGDFATIKYDADGNEVWVSLYNGPDDREDRPVSLAVDALGNVYVTGFTTNNVTSLDYATVKYDTDGNLKWANGYNGIGNSYDQPNDLALDANGNVYVTGSIGIEGFNNDYATVKYHTDGGEEWVRTYNGPVSNYSIDVATSLAVDHLGNVYVTGYSVVDVFIENDTETPDYTYTTIKYGQAVAPPVTVDAGVDQTLYLGYGPNCVTLSAQATEGTPPYGYSWSPGGATSASIQVCPTFTTTYTISITDAGGQTASDEVKVNVIDVRCGKKMDKVLVCHKGKTLCIASSAVEAHLRHGDQLGSCAASPSLNSITENTNVSQLIVERPKRFLVAVAPNPFTTTTRLQYVLLTNGTVSIKVYDVVGKEVATIVQAEQKAGMYSTDLNAANLAKGMYYYRALLATKQNIYTQTGKLMVIK